MKRLLYISFAIVILSVVIIFILSNFRESYNKNTPKFKLNVIIPIRNRDKELNEITDVLEDIFKKQNINATYYIVEQEQGTKFNKGKISNAAFIESIKDNFSDYYLFNDVDVWPENSDVIKYNINTDDIISHPYGQKHCLGCFFLTTKKTFRKINGYSNNYWGWGGEDTDLENRAQCKNVEIDRSDFKYRGKLNNGIIDDVSGDSILTKKNTHNQKLKISNSNKYKQNPDSIYLDGLTTCKYKIISKNLYKQNPKMKKFKVFI
jgi:hypothetical protein